MTAYFQAAAAVLLTVILALTLGSQGKSTANLLVMTAGTMVLLVGMHYLRTVMDFLGQLKTLSGLSGEMVDILIKCTGISLIGEIASLICADAGNSSLGKSLQILSACVILWLCIPAFRSLMDMVQKILEGV